MNYIKKISFSSLSILIIVITCFVIDLSLKNWNKQDRVIEQDVHWYYSYLPAKFIYNDIKLEKSIYQFGENYYLFWPVYTADGEKVIKTTMGLSIMYAPFFFVAHAYACYTDYPENGFSEPYKVFLLLSAIFFLFIGLDFLRKILSHYSFTDKQIAITLFLLGMGTNLLCYASQSAPMSHVYNFCLFAIFFWYTIKWYENATIKNTLIIGLLLGIISLIRPTNILIFVFFAFYGISNWSEFKERLTLFRKEMFLLNLIGLFCILVWIPQIVYWKEVTGDYFFYSYTDEGFFFNHPRILEGLFSFRKGWLLYTPLMAFPLIGLFFLKGLKKVRLALFLLLAINIYVIFSWWCWWYGGTYGQRSMVDFYAFLALPLAYLIKYLSEKGKVINIVFYSICAFFIWLNIFQTYQFENFSLHWEGMTKELYFKQFGKMDKVADYDQYVSFPNFDAAKKGLDCETVEENKDRVSFNGKMVVSKKLIQLKASNGKFVCADESRGDLVVADKDVASTWETFTLLEFANKECALLSFKDKFFSTELNSKCEISANRTGLGGWEIFRLESLPDNTIAFKAVNNKYLCVSTGVNEVSAISDTLGTNAKFVLVYK